MSAALKRQENLRIWCEKYKIVHSLADVILDGALDFKRNGNLKPAADYFSIAYGLYRTIEDVVMMKTTVDYLHELIKDKNSLAAITNYGFEQTNKVLASVDEENKKLNKHQTKQNPLYLKLD